MTEACWWKKTPDNKFHCILEDKIYCLSSRGNPKAATISIYSRMIIYDFYLSLSLDLFFRRGQAFILVADQGSLKLNDLVFICEYKLFRFLPVFLQLLFVLIVNHFLTSLHNFLLSFVLIKLLDEELKFLYGLLPVVRQEYLPLSFL